MKEQKFLIVDDQNDINEWLNKGWEVISVTAQHVSITGSSVYKVRGSFAVVLQYQNPEVKSLNS